MTEEEKKQIVRRTWEELFNHGNLVVADELIAPTFVNHAVPGARPGPEPFKQVVHMYREAFPDAQFTIEELLIDGDKVTMYNTFGGTHQGVFMGIAPTGKHVEQAQMHIVRVADGKVVDHWAVRDDLSLLQQLGAISFRG